MFFYLLEGKIAGPTEPKARPACHPKGVVAVAGGKMQGLVRDTPFLGSLFLWGALCGWTKTQVGRRLRLQEAEVLP